MWTTATVALAMTLSLGAIDPTTASAQHESHSAKNAPSKTTATGKKAMSGHHMMAASEPHHVLAMAYHQNLLVFAKALQKQTARPGAVNIEFTRSAVTEMRRSFDQMSSHHQEHMKTMSPEMHASMNEMMQQMEAHRTELNTQLAALEREAESSTPDAKIIAAAAAEIHRHLDAMDRMHRDGSVTTKKTKASM